VGDYYSRDASMKRKKIAVLTWHYYPNFGSALQAYALQEKLTSMGYRVHILDYRNPKYGIVSRTKTFLQGLLGDLLPRRFPYSYPAFWHRYMHLTRMTYDKNDLPNFVKRYDVCICGSDQIWAPNVFDSVYLLDFVPDNVARVSYAASIGLNDIPNSLAEHYKENLARFQAISIREKAGSELLMQKCGIKAKTVLDPTLMIDVQQWEKIEKRPVDFPEAPFIFCYFLKTDHQYEWHVKEYAKKTNWKVLGYSAREEDTNWFDKRYTKIGPREFVWLIHRAEAIITDSYHGTIFSMLYNKPFVTFERFSAEDAICQNSRLYQLKDDFKLDKQIVCHRDVECLEVLCVDENYFRERLRVLREKSVEYLAEALEDK